LWNVIILLVLTLINYNNMIAQLIATILFISIWPCLVGILFYKDNQFIKQRLEDYKREHNIK